MNAINYKCINNFGCETARNKRIGILEEENSKTVLRKRGVRVVD
jgi:hypothetical protein